MDVTKDRESDSSRCDVEMVGDECKQQELEVSEDTDIAESADSDALVTTTPTTTTGTASGTDESGAGNDDIVMMSSSSSSPSTPRVVKACYTNFKQTTVGRSASCRQCGRLVKDGVSTTSNFLRHIRLPNHKAMLGEYKKFGESDTKQRHLAEYFNQTRSQQLYGRNSAAQKAAQQAIVTAIVECSLPMAIVEHPAFRAMTTQLDPRLNHLCRRTVRKSVGNMCEEFVAELKEKFKKVDTLAVTVDIWSDRKMRSFLGVTGHFIPDGDSKLQTCLLACQRFNGVHNAQNISEAFDSILLDFDVTDKVKYIITDNASNMLKAFTAVFPPSDDDGEEELDAPSSTDDETIWQDLESDVMETVMATRLSCFAHSLQLCVHDGLKLTRPAYGALGKCSKLATLLHTSCKFQECFEETFGPNHGIPQPNNTRWNSTLTHVKAVVKLTREAVTQMLDRPQLSHDHLKFSAREWSQLEELISIFEPFREATEETQGETSATISFVVPCVLALDHHLDALSVKYMPTLVAELKRSLNARFSGIFSRVTGDHERLDSPDNKEPFKDPVYVIATVLDPRWGFAWIPVYTEELLRAELRRYLKELIVSRMPLQQPRPAAAPQAPTGACSSGLFANFHRTESATYTAAEQLNRYIDMSSCALPVTSAIEFWQRNSSRFPGLAVLALEVLTIPASSAPVERVFSHGGIVMRSHRARLHARTLSDLVMAKCNALYRK